MKFSDGTPVTADDVKFSYDLFAKGEGAAADLAPFLANVGSIDVNSPTSLTFHMKKAYAPFTTVAMSQIYILPQHIWQSHLSDLRTFSNVPLVGSGQFTWDYWKKNQEVALKANPAHFAAPKISELIGVTFGTADAVYQALAKQQIDIEQASLLPDEFNSLKKDSFMTATTSDDIGVYYMGFNLDVAPFNNQKFRQALAYTVPFPTIVKTILGGYGKAGDGFIAPANLLWHDNSLPKFTFDLAKTQQLLKAAGFTMQDGKLYMPAPGK
jgi:peptide/nickel transport system substrate-binding protein